MIETALADVQASKAAWTEADLTRAITDALPDHLGVPDGEQIAGCSTGSPPRRSQLAAPLDADRPAEHALPDELRLADGRSAYDAPGRAAVRHPGAHAHRAAARRRPRPTATPPALDRDRSRRFVDRACARPGIELGADQAAAVRGILTSGARVESLVGPAGTGKSFVVGALAHAWQTPRLWDGQQRKVVGLAAPDRHRRAGRRRPDRAQHHPLAGHPAAPRRRQHPTADDLAWRLDPGDLVVVDESAMADTADLAAIHRHVEAAGAKLLLAGDHRQLAAVGAAGGMELPPSGPDLRADRGPPLHPRVGTRRVAAAARRRRDRAGRVPQARPHHRRRHPRTRRALRRPRLAGRHPHRPALAADRGHQRAGRRLSAQLRAELVRLGRVDEDGVPLGVQGTVAGVGDLVQARRNGWDLAGYEGNRRGPINRENYRVLATRDDGGLIVAPAPRHATSSASGSPCPAATSRARRARLRLHRARRPRPAPWTPATPWSPHRTGPPRSTSP